MRNLTVIGAGAILATLAAQDATAAVTLAGGIVIENPVLTAPTIAGDAVAQPDAGPGRRIPDSDLANLSGGEANNVVFTLTNQNLEATVSGNSITAGVLTSGAVSFASNAFSGFNGIGNFVINTGNNNTLQGSLSVTVIGH